MPDREKVIKGLEVCFDSSKECNGCPYIITPYCRTTLRKDVIALLKEQEAVEPKTGYWIGSAGNDKCSICGTEYSDLYPDYGNTHFCPNCGAKMEGRRREMEWDQYKKQMPVKPEEWQYKTQVNVECPKCGKKIWRRNDIVLTSYPEQYQYECECGWVGYAHI